MLSESQDLTQVLVCGIRTPTGRTENGNGQTVLTPQYEFWYGGLPDGWVVRGGTGMSIPTNNAGGGRTTYTKSGKFARSCSTDCVDWAK